VQQIVIEAARRKYIKHVYFIRRLSFYILLTITLSGLIGGFW